MHTLTLGILTQGATLDTNRKLGRSKCGLEFMAPSACLALVLGWVQLCTGRLAAAWAVHAVHNGVQVAIIVLLPEML